MNKITPCILVKHKKNPNIPTISQLSFLANRNILTAKNKNIASVYIAVKKYAVGKSNK